MDEVAFPRGGRPKSNKNDSAATEGSKERKRSRSSSSATTTTAAAAAAAKGANGDAAATAERDFLFGSPPTTDSTTASNKKKKKRKVSIDKSTSELPSLSSRSLMPLGGGGVVVHQQQQHAAGDSTSDKKKKKQPTRDPLIEALSFSKLAKHTKLLAVVREVQEDFCIVSLPNFLSGYILRNTKINNNSKFKGADSVPLTHSLLVGQVLSVVIVKTASEVIGSGRHQATRRRIQVTVHPNVVNPVAAVAGASMEVPMIRGQVTSIEDHGVLVHLGHGRQGFLSFDEISGDFTTDPISEQDEDEDDDEDEGDDNNQDDNEDDDQPSKYKHRLNVGRILDVYIKDRDDTKKIIALKLPNRQKMSELVVPTRSGSSSPPSLALLTPGWLVSCKIEAFARNGLCVTFWNNAFRGAIELAHLGGTWMPVARQPVEGSLAWKQVFTEKDNRHIKFDARIVAVDVATKVIRLTLLPHLLNLQVTPDSASNLFPPVGSVITNAKVVRLDPGVGATLALPDDGEAKMLRLPPPKALKENESFLEARRIRTVYVHISKAADGGSSRSNQKGQKGGKTSDSAFAKEFAPTTIHTIRILNTNNWLEGMASASTAQSVVQAHVLTYSDLQPGQVYRQVPICAHLVAAKGDGSSGSGGILVDLGMGVRGLVPAIHLFDTATNTSTSDFRNRLFKSKFALDAKLDVRVLSVDTKLKRVTLTAKKSLVQCADDEVIASFAEVKVGQQAVGFVTRIDDHGLYVTFCNKVYGCVTATSLAADLGVENHKQNYHVGDVVKCRVMSVKKRTGKKKKLYDEEEDDEESDNDNQDENDMDIDDDGNKRIKVNPNLRVHWQLNLSLKLYSTDSDDEDEIADTPSTASSERRPKKLSLLAGAVLPPKSMKIVELVKGRQKDGGGFVPGYALVRIKSKFIVDDTNGASLLPFIECKLPYDQLIDHYRAEDTASATALDALAEGVLVVGKKINQKGLVMEDPKKSTDEYASGIGRLTVVSLRPKLIETAEASASKDDAGETTSRSTSIILPSPKSQLYVGANVHGYVIQVHQKHGAFIRFLDGMTGLIPRVKRGLELPLFNTITARVVALDVTTRPMKILLQHATSTVQARPQIKRGDKISSASVTDVSVTRAKLKITDKRFSKDKAIRARVHCTMAVLKSMLPLSKPLKKPPRKEISKYHPFHQWKIGMKLTDLEVVSVDTRKGITYVELTNRLSDDDKEDSQKKEVFFRSKSELKPGQEVTGIVTFIPKSKSGVWLQLSPGVTGFVPALELTSDAKVLNQIQAYYPVGAPLDVIVTGTTKKLSKSKPDRLKADNDVIVRLSSLLRGSAESVVKGKDSCIVAPKPIRGDLLVGRIKHSIPSNRPPALMLELRGGIAGRCCITELDEVDDWINMPLGRAKVSDGDQSAEPDDEEEEADMETEETGTDEARHRTDADEQESSSRFPNGKYVLCRVLAGIPSQPFVEVSLRSSRIEGDIEEDEPPSVGDMIHAYVMDTNKSGCFLRSSRQIEGRVTLKELCDGFLHNPVSTFPMGRLVVGKVKAIRKVSEESDSKKRYRKAKGGVKFIVDLDMRESVLLESTPKLQFEDVAVERKYKGIVTRIESYGVFVRLENSNVSGLAHTSECSDKFIKNLQDLYDPGDLVKVLVIKKDVEGKKLGFSLKASHFENDPNSDDDDDDNDEESDEESVEAPRAKRSDGEDDMESDDENFVSKLASEMRKVVKDDVMDEDDSQDEDMEEDDKDASINDLDDDEDDAEEEEEEVDDIDDEGEPEDDSDSDDEEGPTHDVLDTNVGFNWSAGATRPSPKVKVVDDDSDESSGESEDEESEDNAKVSSHKSRRKQSQRRREEQETFRRETALADGTADENPETAADFERLLAGSPNSSELWIRYMAFYLSLADTDAARAVAKRAFDRIDFRQEGEKLNVWTALLTLEIKYGDQQSLQDTTDLACQHNNPKQVYLRLCEIVAKHAHSSADSALRADEMFEKMCKRFKSKKTVWIAYLEYLLKQNRHKEAHSVSKRALVCLPSYKHIETMSKFAQLEFEYGSAERARTILDGLLEKYPKRLDILFVYVDKEIKFGDVEAARRLLEKRSMACTEQKLKLSVKQMKSLFRKWYRLEEEHGTPETCEKVKDAAKVYVERS